MEKIVRERVGDFIYGVGDYPLENAVIALLQENGAKIAISETGTGIALYERIIEAEGGEAVLANHQTCETIPTLQQALDTTESEIDKLVKQAAQNLIETSNADIVIAILTKNDGTAIAVANQDTVRKRVYGYGGEATQAPIWAGTWGLSMAWRLIREKHLEK